MLVRSMDAGKAAAKYEKRKNAVEAVMRGEPVSVVARVHAVPQRTIFGWLARYRAGGWHALEEGRRSGRPRKVSAETRRYAPEFNPDEQVWNHAKGRLAKLFIDSKATLKSSMLAILLCARSLLPETGDTLIA